MAKGIITRTERVLRYFIEAPEKPGYGIWVVLIIAFSLLIIKGCTEPGIAGGLLIMIGLAGLYIVIRQFARVVKQYRNELDKAAFKATDEEMDEWLDAGYRLIFDNAKSSLGIKDGDIIALPLLLDGPAAGTSITSGNDDKLRFSHHHIFLLFLTSHKIAVYRCTFDAGTGGIQEGRTIEFAFNDITNLETGSVHTTIRTNSGKARVAVLQTLSLYTSGSNKLTVDYLYPPNTENTIKAIRKLIAEYKDKYSN